MTVIEFIQSHEAIKNHIDCGSVNDEMLNLCNFDNKSKRLVTEIVVLSVRINRLTKKIRERLNEEHTDELELDICRLQLKIMQRYLGILEMRASIMEYSEGDDLCRE